MQQSKIINFSEAAHKTRRGKLVYTVAQNIITLDNIGMYEYADKIRDWFNREQAGTRGVIINLSERKNHAPT